MLDKILKDFEKYCIEQFVNNYESCDGCKYFKDIGDGTRYECFKLYLKDNNIK